MEYSSIERRPDELQQPVSCEHIITMCQRAFGNGVSLLSACELAGGLYNNTYRIDLANMPTVILRVAPERSREQKHEQRLMRNELLFQPFFAPIATLMPRILMADFTHQLLDRDYLFQTFMQGEQWQEIMHELTVEENNSLWRQLGSITKTIHSVEGETPGHGTSSQQPLTSGYKVMNWLTATIEAIKAVQLDASDLLTVLKIVKANTSYFDEITRPHWLHGDLWAVNILVQRGGEDGPTISAVLDADRASWGDPLSDWSIFLLNYHQNAQAFWDTYGWPAQSQAAQFRRLIYRATHLGGVRLEQYRLQHMEKVERSYRDLQTILVEVQNIVS